MAGHTLTRALHDRAAIARERIALDFEDRSFTFHDVHEHAAEWARRLDAAHVTRGTRVALLSPNRPEFVFALYAALRVGATVAMCSPAGKAAEIAAGAGVRLHPRFDLDASLHAIANERMTLDMAVAPIALAMANHSNLESYDLSSLASSCGARHPWSRTSRVPSATGRGSDGCRRTARASSRSSRPTRSVVRAHGGSTAPAEAEAVLHGDARGHDCAVFGGDDPDGGDAIVAAVALVPVPVPRARPTVPVRRGRPPRELQADPPRRVRGLDPPAPVGKALRRSLKQRFGRTRAPPSPHAAQRARAWSGSPRVRRAAPVRGRAPLSLRPGDVSRGVVRVPRVEAAAATHERGGAAADRQPSAVRTYSSSYQARRISCVR